jgi:hypothetical protein
MKRILFSLAILTSVAFYATAQDMRIQQGAAPTIRMSSGSTATTASWAVDAGVSTTGATLTRTWSESVGNHTLSVIPQNATSCSGATSNYTIEVFITLPVTDPNITGISMSSACPITANNLTSTSTATLALNSYFPAATAYTVSYTVGAGAEQTVSLAAGATTFTIDANAAGITAGGSAIVTITKFKISGSSAVALASGPNGTLNVNAVPTITGIE